MPNDMPHRHHRVRSTAALGLLALLLAGADDVPRVTITGGADATGQNYEWRVRNNSNSRIVEVVFPHYHADMFIVPDPEVWKRECTNLSVAGAKNAGEPGTCRAWVTNKQRGIAPGFDAVFRMRIARVGAQHRPGQVIVRFADGTQTTVSGVEVPSRPTFGERYVMAIGMGLVFLLIVWSQMRRRRAGAEPAPDHPTIPPDDGS